MKNEIIVGDEIKLEYNGVPILGQTVLLCAKYRGKDYEFYMMVTTLYSNDNSVSGVFFDPVTSRLKDVTNVKPFGSEKGKDLYYKMLPLVSLVS